MTITSLLSQVSDWLASAQQSEINDPSAVTLSTVDEDGWPDARIVLVKEVDITGGTLSFYTNYHSPKAQQLAHNPYAAITFHWKSLLKQIRIRGTVRKTTSEKSDQYFYSRSYDSQISAVVSDQSKPLQSKAHLLDKVDDLQKEYPEKVQRPEYWGGYELTPTEFEFWEDGAHRRHDRFRWTINAKGVWENNRLYP